MSKKKEKDSDLKGTLYSVGFVGLFYISFLVHGILLIHRQILI